LFPFLFFFFKNIAGLASEESSLHDPPSSSQDISSSSLKCEKPKPKNKNRKKEEEEKDPDADTDSTAA
jgi:hypothetical protein